MSLLLDLSIKFGLGAADLLRIIKTAPARYRVYEIPKRQGGTRTIAHPARDLKAIQRYILSEKLTGYRVHDAATAYVKGRGIGQNADAHRRSESILKLDFSEFFHSVVVRDWERFARSNPMPEIELSDLRYYSKILFWGQDAKSQIPRCLSIGAPTSPALSNILMYDLDVAFAEIADRCGVVYTRYADDITASASGSEPLLRFEREVRRKVSKTSSPRLMFNEDKRGLYSLGQRRMVTGLILTPAQSVSLGRERKREISSLMHRYTLEQLDVTRLSYLKGMLGFAIAHEPDFLSRLRLKYGDGAVDRVLKYSSPKKLVQGP